jgi:hypothetical protein
VGAESAQAAKLVIRDVTFCTEHTQTFGIGGNFLPADNTGPATNFDGETRQLAHSLIWNAECTNFHPKTTFDNLDLAKEYKNMRRVYRLSAFLVIASALAFAETWSGKLIDAGCADPQKTEACVPTASTAAFAINAAGKVLKLDAAGNTKAAEAMKARENSADRAKNANREITATVQGTASEDTIKVDSIELR